MKNFLKRILALALVLVMVAGYVPTSVFAAEETAPAKPTASITEIANDDYTFAVNVKSDTPAWEQEYYYGTWKAELVMKFTKDVTLNADGSADGYVAINNIAGVTDWMNAPETNVTLPANYGLDLFSYIQGDNVSYYVQLLYFKDFQFAVKFDEDFLAANEGLQASLELKLTSYETGEVVSLASYTYGAPEKPTATVKEITNKNLTYAMNFKVNTPTAEQLAYYGEWYADFELSANYDMVLDANGTGDGWLSGEYADYGWINVPFQAPVELKTGKPVRIMATAAEQMGKTGLKYTVKEIYDVVKDFNCGIYLDDEFLLAHPDLVVTLELKIYNKANEAECYTIEKFVFDKPVKPALPDAIATEIVKEDLTFAMNFKTGEVNEAQANYYASWYADFEILSNVDINLYTEDGGDGWLSGAYGDYGWINVPFNEAVLLEADKPVRIMETAAAQMGQSGLKMTCAEIYTVVQNFNCGVYLKPEFLAAHPELEITLQLRIYNDQNEEESYIIGNPYVFKAASVPELPTATANKTKVDGLTFSMNFQADEASAKQLAYYGKWFTDFEIVANKDIVWDANGTGDGYLAGQYDGEWESWHGEWYNVPFKAPVAMQAGVPVRIMETAAAQMGEPGLRYTYKEAYEVVKDFDCGVLLTPEFLVANPDLEITLCMKMYNPTNEAESYIIGVPYVFKASEIPAIPTATVADLAKEDLTFAMNFKADEATAEQLAYYGKWFADFELKVNKPVTFDANGTGDGWLSGQYDGEWESWHGEWYNVPFKAPVSLAANEVVKIMATAAAQMGEPGLKYTYQEVYDVVKDFDCGVFFEPEFLAANPDLVVTLELRMYNPYDESISYKIGDTYVFANEYVAYNVQTGKLYSKVSTATMEAQAGETVRLLKDTEDMIVNILNDVTLDLDGHYLETFYMCSFGHIIDGREENTGRLETQNILINPANAQLPIMQNGAYGFYEIKKAAATVLTKTQSGIEVPEGGVVYCFQFQFEDLARELLKSGQDATKVNIVVRATWTRTDGTTAIQHFVYTDELVNGVLNSYNPANGKMGKMYTLTLNSVAEFPNLTCQACVVNADKVEYSVAPSAAAAANSQAVNLTDDNASAVVPQGALINGKAEDLALQVSDLERTSSNITVSAGEELKAVDVHVSGIASGNKVPVIVTVNQMVAAGLNSGNLALYHVENGATVTMTQVATLEEVNAHNEFYYDPATGDVTMALASFSEVTAVSETDAAWKGEFDYNWYTNPKNPDFFEIANADQLAAFGAIVGEMAFKEVETKEYGYTFIDPVKVAEGNTFEGKTVKLIADINLGSNIFYPIGYSNGAMSYEKSSDGTGTGTWMRPFKGIFDGNGHTISNFTQNTWGMLGDYNGNYYNTAMGLFAWVEGGTVKNLTVNNFKSEGEYAPTGVITAYATGNSTFENIAITNCNPGVYNTGNGGIIGIAGDSTGEYTINLTNITVDNTNKITALWGSWDVACGGLVGMLYGNDNGGTINFKNCHVAAEIDVYNDVCANYQYYAFRYSGMLIGSVRKNETIDGHVYPLMKGITANGCTATYGTWVNNYYCELVANTLASYTHDHQMSRLTKITNLNEIYDGANWLKTGNFIVVDANEMAVNSECYHIMKDADGKLYRHEHEDSGYETSIDEDKDGEVDLKEDKQRLYLPFSKQLVTGYGWGVTSKGIEAFDGAVALLNVADGAVAASVEKFTGTDKTVPAGTKVNIGELFAAKGGNTVGIVDKTVQVYVSPADEDSTVVGTYEANTTDWTKGTLTLNGSGAATITITDYYFCTPTTITVNVEAETPVVAKIGDTEFETLQDALKAAQTGDVVILQANVETSKYLDIANGGVERTFTLDLNGKTISTAADFNYNANYPLVFVGVNQNVTIVGGEIIADKEAAIGVYGKLHLNGVTVESKAANSDKAAVCYWNWDESDTYWEDYEHALVAAGSVTGGKITGGILVEGIVTLSADAGFDKLYQSEHCMLTLPKGYGLVKENDYYVNLHEHVYSAGKCTVCDEAEDLSGAYYITAQKTEGNYFWATSDLGDVSNKRYQTVDSGLTVLPTAIAKDDVIMSQVFVLEKNEDGKYFIYTYVTEAGVDKVYYLSWEDTSDDKDNIGILVNKEDALAVNAESVTVDGASYVNIYFAVSETETRYLSMNNNGLYFAWYKVGQKNDLSLVPAEGVLCDHVNKTATVNEPTCIADGSVVVTCDDCDVVLRTTAGASKLGHNYVNDICERCERVKPDWLLADSANDLQIGSQIIIAAKDFGVAMSTEQKTNNRGSVVVTKDDDGVAFVNGVQIATLEEGVVEGTYALKVNGGYLYSASGKDVNTNNLKTKLEKDETASWYITFDEAGNCTIKCAASERKSNLLYNSNENAKLFGCYGDENTVKAIAVYVGVCKHSVTETTNTATCNEAGYKIVTCASCGVELSRTEVPATGAHEYKEVVTAPTCTDKGYTTHTCACGHSYTDNEVEATGHSYTTPAFAWAEDFSCEATYGCANCTESFKASCDVTHDGKVASCKEEVIKTYTATVTIGEATYTGTKTEILEQLAHNYVDGVCSVCGTKDPNQAVKYTITFAVPNGMTAPTAQTGTSGTVINLPTADAVEGYTFVGWVEDVVEDATEAPAAHTGEYAVKKDITLYALYSIKETAQAGGFVKTDVSKIESDDVVVITITKSGKVYAMSNDKGTSSGPAPVLVTVTNNAITSEIAETIKWNITNSNGSLTIYPNGTTAKWLYCTASNNGVRVGTNANKTFTIDATSGYLKNTATSRYLGVYNTQDWRCYTSTSTNIANQTLAFYVEAKAEETYYYTTNPVVPCKHTNITTTTVDATCTVDGSTTVTCDDCGETISTEPIKATGHNYIDGVCSCGEKEPSSAEPTTLATFALGANGSASHYDGSEKSSHSETVNGYTLSITGGSKMYTGARDAKGNSCFKLGTDSKAGSFQFTVPSDVTKVVIYIAKYKANTSKVKINGTTYTLTKNSNDGAYDAIEIDTTSTKTITLTTVSGGYRAMVNTIEFIGVAK